MQVNWRFLPTRRPPLGAPAGVDNYRNIHNQKCCRRDAGAPRENYVALNEMSVFPGLSGLRVSFPDRDEQGRIVGRYHLYSIAGPVFYILVGDKMDAEQSIRFISCF
jgi:hypothetical protein